MTRYRSGVHELEFYSENDRLYARIFGPDPNNVPIIEIERKTKGGIVQNPEAYARYGKQIARFKAGETPPKPAVRTPAPKPAPKPEPAEEV